MSDLGEARGVIRIDVSQIAAAQAAVAAASRQMAQAINALAPATQQAAQGFNGLTQSINASAQATAQMRSSSAGLQAALAAAAAASNANYLASQQAAQGINQVGVAARNTQPIVGQLSGAFRQLAGAFGIFFGAQGVAQLTRALVASEKLATAYSRQRVAAANLAGSQAQLNDLLRAYDQATGNAVDKATALADVTRLQAVGFADSAEELNRFVRAARGISVATGQSQDYVISQLQLAIANQSTMRLDQLGLGVSEVKQRIDELKAANSGLTTEMAYQQAILGLAEQKFGALVDSTAAQATGAESATKAWRDFRLAAGEAIRAPVDNTLDVWTKALRGLTEQMEAYNRARAEADFNIPVGATSREIVGIENARRQAESQADIDRMNLMWNRLRYQAGVTQLNPDGPSFAAPVPSWMTSATPFAGPAATPARFTDEQEAAIVEWSRAVQDIERQANRDRLAATRQYEEQRSSTIRQYEQTIAREAQDFATSRLRAEEDYARGVQRFRRDIAQREARQLEDLERTIAEARSEAAERGAERQVALDERLAETRAASQERILEMEADFARRQERASRNHARSLRDAAANLDAVRIRELQRGFRESQQEAQEDFDTRLGKERTNEAKRLAELSKAHAKQTADEGRALDKRLRQANEAYRRQLEDARAADEQRLSDQAADYALRLERENADRAERLKRLAEDHADQLAEQARQHELRLLQLAEQERDEIQLANEAFDARMAELGIFHAGVKEREAAHYTRGLIAYQEYLDAKEAELARRTAIQGPLASPWAGPTFGGGVPPIAPSSVSTNNARTNTIMMQAGAIQVFPLRDVNEDQLSNLVVEKMAEFLEDYQGR